MLSLLIKDLSLQDTQNYLQHAIGPRPICFASTIDKEGNVNLSPFSFFNLFSTDPAIIIFSPSRRIRDNTTKHSLQNVLEVLMSTLRQMRCRHREFSSALKHTRLGNALPSAVPRKRSIQLPAGEYDDDDMMTLQLPRLAWLPACVVCLLYWPQAHQTSKTSALVAQWTAGCWIGAS